MSKAADGSEALTIRGMLGLQLVAWGNGGKQAAAGLSIYCETAQMHLKQILEKLGSRDRVHAAATVARAAALLELGEQQEESRGNSGVKLANWRLPRPVRKQYV